MRGVCVLSVSGFDVQRTCSSQAPCVCDCFLCRKGPPGGFQDSELGSVELLSPGTRHTRRSPCALGMFPASGGGRTISLGFNRCLSVAATWRRCLRVDLLFGVDSIRILTTCVVRATPAKARSRDRVFHRRLAARAHYMWVYLDWSAVCFRIAHRRRRLSLNSGMCWWQPTSV